MDNQAKAKCYKSHCKCNCPSCLEERARKDCPEYFNQAKATPKVEEPLAYYEQIMPIDILQLHPNKDERMKLIIKAVNSYDALMKQAEELKEIMASEIKKKNALLEACRLAEEWLNALRTKPNTPEYRNSLASKEFDVVYALRQAINQATK